MKKVKIEDTETTSDSNVNLQDDNSSNSAPQGSAKTGHGYDATDLSEDTVQSAPSSSAANSDSDSVQDASDQSQVTELLNDLQRTRADFENYRKQVESQKSLAMSTAKYATVEKFLPLVDDFERALSAYPEQLSPLRKNLDKTLAALGLAHIDSEPGTEFNPDLHEAVSVEDDEGETEVIAETLRPGYLYEDTVIRAAMVKVKHK